MNITVNTEYMNKTPATVLKGKYRNGDTALMLRDNEYGEQLAVATVNLEEYGEHPAEGNVFIKDWSENAGMLACLVEQGVVSEPIREVPSGYAVAYECKLVGNPVELR